MGSKLGLLFYEIQPFAFPSFPGPGPSPGHGPSPSPGPGLGPSLGPGSGLRQPKGCKTLGEVELASRPDADTRTRAYHGQPIKRKTVGKAEPASRPDAGMWTNGQPIGWKTLGKQKWPAHPTQKWKKKLTTASR